jgi:peptide/nickel transport system ATP-binding protein
VTEPALLSIEDVSVDLPTPRGNLRAVDHVDLTIGAGRTLGIVGESGCGKTMLSRAILQLLPKKAKLSGRVMFDGQDLVRLAPERLRKLRGRSLAVVFQDPMTSLNPVLTIGTQLIETLQEHLELDGSAARKRSVELLAAVGIAAPEQRLMQYPHQLSGGMRQRVAIAIALSCEPKLSTSHPLRAIRFSTCKILSLNMRSAARRFTPCRASACRLRAAKRLGWSENPAAANPPWAARCCSCASRSRDAFCSTAMTSQQCRARPCGECDGGCS